MQAGLPCAVYITWSHNHELTTAAAMCYRPAELSLKDLFFGYFNDGLSPAGAMSYHKHNIEMSVDFKEEYLADGCRNPIARSVYYWHNEWRKINFGMDLHIQTSSTDWFPKK